MSALRQEWEGIHRLARFLRSNGHFPPELVDHSRRVGFGVEKQAYAVDQFPGWVFKLGSGSRHTAEHRTFHLLPPKYRPRSVYYPLRTADDVAHVTVQEECTPLSLLTASTHNSLDKGGYSVIERKKLSNDLSALGFVDQHLDNIALTRDDRMVTIDWGMYHPVTQQKRKKTQPHKIPLTAPKTHALHTFGAAPAKREPGIWQLPSLPGFLRSPVRCIASLLPGVRSPEVSSRGARNALRRIPTLKFYDEPRNHF